MSRGRRVAAALAVAALVATSLSGCVVVQYLLGITTSYSDTVTWLEDQPILTSVEKITEYEKEYETHGEVRGELDPAATPAEIEAFALKAVAFLDTQDRNDVHVSLGHGAIDFAIDDEALTRKAIPIWQQVEELPDIRGALVSGNIVTTRSLRTDVPAVVAGLQTLGAGFRAEGLDDDAAFETDVPPRAYFGQIDERVVGTVLFENDCTLDPAALALALDLVAGGAGGKLNLCYGWGLNYLDPIGDKAIALRAQLDAAGFDFRVSMSMERLTDYDTREREVWVTGGSADALEIVLDIERAGLPDDASYTLDENRELTISDYDAPVAPLAELVVGSSALPALGMVILHGDDFSLTAPAAGLGALRAEAQQLDDAAPVFSYANYAVDTLELYLPDGGGAPKAIVRDAAEALFDSGAWKDRQVTVDGDRATLVIDAGDVGEIDGGGSGADPLTWFRDEWVSLYP